MRVAVRVRVRLLSLLLLFWLLVGRIEERSGRLKKVRRGMVMAWWLVVRGVFGRAGGGVGRRCSNARGGGGDGGGGCDVAMREGDIKLSRWLALRGIDRLIVNKPRRQFELVPCCVGRGRRKNAGADFCLTRLPDWECQEIRSIADNYRTVRDIPGVLLGILCR